MGMALGDKLADWLDGLGLADQLAEAGLPTFTRDDAGTPHWIDPTTDEPMSQGQLEALEAKLRGQGSDPRHGIPLQLVQLARQAQVREQLVATPTHTYESLAAVRGDSVNATRFSVHKARDLHRVLLVTSGADLLIPAFQFDHTGQPRQDLIEVLPPLLAAGMDPWRAWAWLTMPAALLTGLVPADAAADPETADLARHAAVRLAGKVAGDVPSPKPPSVCGH